MNRYIVQFDCTDGCRDEFPYWDIGDAFEHMGYFEDDDNDGLYKSIKLLEIDGKSEKILHRIDF